MTRHTGSIEHSGSIKHSGDSLKATPGELSLTSGKGNAHRKSVLHNSGRGDLETITPAFVILAAINTLGRELTFPVA